MKNVSPVTPVTNGTSRLRCSPYTDVRKLTMSCLDPDCLTVIDDVRLRIEMELMCSV
ncbi:hypothetical protein KIN20_013875 [Parelaphostrongylus tenuis]|uniref:Uncharacterized protein n=1 Tax=Parelaphostrongylus tenuis TaxID=148309 RepID=A0AAD5MCR6_PARTN|nr:hypothetical protein KIN20_013875 [Parelaphostrongylus tenuis]